MATVSRGEITITNVNDGNTGTDGVSFTGITSYYLVSANSTGITTATSGWSTTPPATTTTNKYLWNYDKINYSDGKSTNSTPMIIGTHGATGNNGTDATAYWVTPSVNVIKKSASGTLSPTTILFSGYAKTGTANTVSYAGRFIISTSTDGVTYTNAYTSASNQSTYTYTIPTTVKFIKVRMYLAGGTSVLLDEQTIPILESAEDLVVSERNLLLKSNVPYSDTSYGTWWKMTEFMEEGVDYTLKVKGTIGAGKSYMAAFLDGEIINLGSLKDNGDGTYSVTFKGKKGSRTDYNALYIYFIPGSVTVTNTIEWIKLVKGNTMFSQWSPAPEEAQLYPAWSNDPNGKDMVRVYPNENLVLKDKIGSHTPYNTKPIIENDGALLTTTYIGTVKFFTISLGFTPKNTYYTVSGRMKINGVPVTKEAMSSNRANTYNATSTVKTATVDNQGNFVYTEQYTGTNALVFHTRITTLTANDIITIENFKFEESEYPTIYTPSPQEDPVKAEMAYIGYSPKDSNNPADYVWSENPKVKGTFKRWSNDPNGLVDFTAVYPNENLLRTTTSESTIVGVGQSNQTDARTNYTLLTTPFNTLWADMKVGDTFTFSCDVTIAGSGFAGQFRPQTASTIWLAIGSYYNVTKAETTRVSFTGTVTQSVIDTAAVTMIQIRYDNIPTTVSIKVSKPKLERGNVATPYTTSKEEDLLLQIPQYIGIGNKDSNNPADYVWTVSPEYTQARTDLGLDEKADQKDLDDVRDTADHANNLGENSVQQNEFYSWLEDDYAKQIDEMKSISEQSQADLQNIDGRTALIESNLGNMSEKWNFIDTSITMAEEGILISDKADKMSILVSSGRIVFFDNEVEVAYITSQMLNISRGVFLESATIGNHVITKYSNTSPVTIIRYVGDVI